MNRCVGDCDPILKNIKENEETFSSLSATYRAYETDAARIKHKPMDVDSVEWHYLMKYFASEKFKVR